MDGARSQEPTRNRGAGPNVPAPVNGVRKDDSAISMGSSQGNDSESSANRPTDDVVMGNTTPASDVPAALQPGNMANRLVQTSKGLWNPEAAR
jgi:hypothetical protein